MTRQLPDAARAGRAYYSTTTVTYLHAEVTVWSPAPDGAAYQNYATCTHNHPDTEAGVEEVMECAERLARIISAGRLPKWAVFG